MNIESIRAFIDGIIIGVLVTLLINKIYVEIKFKKYEKAICSAIDKLLKETSDDIPIEKEDEIL